MQIFVISFEVFYVGIKIESYLESYLESYQFRNVVIGRFIIDLSAFCEQCPRREEMSRE